MIRYHRNYFTFFLIILLIEVFIALYIKDRYIRPYFGDVLVVILIYTFIKSFTKISNKNAIIIVITFSFSIEISQAFHLIEILGLERYQIAHWVLGSSFNYRDFIAYLVGILIIMFFEQLVLKSNQKRMQ